MQLIRRNNIGQQIGRGANALQETNAADVLALLGQGNNVADFVIRNASSNGGTTPAAGGTQQLPPGVATEDPRTLQVKRAAIEARLKQYSDLKAEREKARKVLEEKNRVANGANGNGNAANAGSNSGDNGGRDGGSTEAAGRGLVANLGGKAALNTVAGLISGAPLSTAAQLGIRSIFSPVGLATSVANAVAKAKTGYGVMDNLAAGLQDMTGVDMNKLSLGFLTPNPQGAFGDARTESTSFGVTGFNEGNSTTRAEMNGTIAAQAPTGTYTPGNPVLAAMTAEQVTAATKVQQAIVTAAAAVASRGSNSSNSGPGGGASQTSASAMSNPNNTSSPAQVGGHSGYGGGGSGMGYGGGNSTSNSGTNGTGRGGGNYSGGGHSGAGGVGA